MKLVVGLGNPGKEYEQTRHNIGFDMMNVIKDVYGLNFTYSKKFNAEESTGVVDGEKIIFIKPYSYMNLSGEVVRKYMEYYDIDVKDILVIQDDLDMETGKYKLMFNHGDGGHNGIKNIILNLNSREFLRLKIGISKANINTKDYVLGKFNSEEKKIISYTFKKLDNFIIDYVGMNRDLLTGKYNSKEKETNKE